VKPGIFNVLGGTAPGDRRALCTGSTQVSELGTGSWLVAAIAPTVHHIQIHSATQHRRFIAAALSEMPRGLEHAASAG